MRIVSGKFRGKVIRAPKNLPVRPTTDMAKEALLNILGNRKELDGANVLDLFSGTGNIAFEFISRGAGNVVSVDVNQQCVRFIGRIFEELGADNAKAIRCESRKFISNCNDTYDFIFLDPPYAMEKIEDVVVEIFEHKLLAEDGMVILEHSSRLDFTNLPQYKESRAYGQSAFTFFG